jgi:hypothetical protein
VKERFEFSEWSWLKLALSCEDLPLFLHEHHALNQASFLEPTVAVLRQFMHVHTEQDGARAISIKPRSATPHSRAAASRCIAQMIFRMKYHPPH